jgi:hypothetical protein
MYSIRASEELGTVHGLPGDEAWLSIRQLKGIGDEYVIDAI